MVQHDNIKTIYRYYLNRYKFSYFNLFFCDGNYYIKLLMISGVEPTIFTNFKMGSRSTSYSDKPQVKVRLATTYILYIYVFCLWPNGFFFKYMHFKTLKVPNKNSDI